MSISISANDPSQSVLAQDIPVLGDWSDYNGIVFGDATIYESTAGGALAIQDSIAINSDFTIGSTYTSLYNSTQDIGEYTNPLQLPTFLFGGDTITIGSNVNSLPVYGGAISMSAQALAVNQSLPVGFIPETDAYFQEMEQSQLKKWFTDQHALVQNTSSSLLKGNSKSIDIGELASGSYLSYGPEYFENDYFQIQDNKILCINVNSENDINFGQWWPVHSQIIVDINWAITYDLVVFNFPDAVNVTMNSNAFNIQNMTHWSTTVDAWIGEQGMIERQSLCQKVIYNFPNALTMETTEALIQGTIMAPKATFSGVGFGNNGHLYGHLIVKNFTAENNFTIHAFALDHLAYDIVQNIISEDTKKATIHLQQYLYFDQNRTTTPVTGGQFVLVDMQGKYYDGDQSFVDTLQTAMIYSLTTNALVIETVPLGQYTLQNIRTPDGFLRNDSDTGTYDTYFSIALSLSKENETVSVNHYVELVKADFTFKKLDEDTRVGLSNTEFVIIREGDQFQEGVIGANYTSDNNGEFQCSNLTIGNYTLTELEPSDGYGLIENGEFQFTVYWDEDVEHLALKLKDGSTVSGSILDPVAITNSTNNQQNSLLIVKYATQGSEEEIIHPLANAHFDLYQYHSVADTWSKVEQNISGEMFSIITNDFGYYRVQNLMAGTYRIVETKAPTGYQVSNIYTDTSQQDIFPTGYTSEFTFNEEVSFFTAYSKGLALTCDVRIHVYSDFLKQHTAIHGATFTLERLLQDDVWEVVSSSVQTTASGNILFKYLEAGTYRLTQETSAIGYQIASPQSITFDVSFAPGNEPILLASYDGQNVSENGYPVSISGSDPFIISIVNEAKTRGFSVFKTDANQQKIQDENQNVIYKITYLEDAIFALQRKNPATNQWEDYGDEFVSHYQYDEQGEQLLDSFGNPITKATFSAGLLYGEYRLIETKAPIGYIPVSNIEVTLVNGTTGNLVYSFTITQSMTGTTSQTQYTLTDYSLDDVTSLSFQKVDTTDLSIPLANAKFALYSCDLNHPHDSLATKESCWSENTPIMLKSNYRGIVVIGDLQTREYILQEVTAPVGYTLPLSQWLIKVNAVNETFEITVIDTLIDTLNTPTFIPVEENQEITYVLPNLKKHVLPLTGGTGVTILLVMGSLMVILALSLLYKRQIHQKKERYDEPL